MNVEIRNISKSFGRNSILKDINFSVESGKCIGILGGNGSGKSTLLSILAGLQRADRGEFLCDCKNLFKDSKERSALIGYVPQGIPLIEELNAQDNLLLWYEKNTLKKELSDGILSMLGIDDFLKITVSKMSGGMKKRLSIGCAMSKHPPILLLDEPMAALDLTCKQLIFEYLNKHKAAGGIIILVTHDIFEIELCDKWFIIKDGVLLPFEYDGDIEKLVKSL